MGKKKRFRFKGLFVLLVVSLMFTVPQITHATSFTATNLLINSGYVTNTGFFQDSSGHFTGTDIATGGIVTGYDISNNTSTYAIGNASINGYAPTPLTGTGTFDIANFLQPNTGTMTISYAGLTDTNGPTYKYEVVVSLVNAALNQTVADHFGVNTAVSGNMTITLFMGPGSISTPSPVLASTFSANFTTTPASVPIPAAGWLLGTGIVGLFGIRRKMRS